MTNALALATRSLVMLFVVANMLALGMSVGLREIAAPLRRPGWCLTAILANFVVLPLVAYGVMRTMPLPHGVAIGLGLLATAAGGPFVTKLAEIAHADMPHTLSLVVALQLVSIIYMPAAIPWILPGITVDWLAVAEPLLLLNLLPLVVGGGVKVLDPRLAGRLCGPLDRLSGVAIGVALLLIVADSLGPIIASVGRFLILPSAILVWAGFGTGYLLGGPRAPVRSALGLSTAVRGYSAALVVAITDFPEDPDVQLVMVISLLIGIATLGPFAIVVLRRRNRSTWRADGCR
jgi:BASS family bile acid:Na+ symporter